MYLALLAALTVFTLLDTANIAIGLRIGLVELNPTVTMLGLSFWVTFRVALLISMLTLFLAAYTFCVKHFPKGTWILRTTLLMLDTYIATVVASGLLAMYAHLL